MGVRKPLAILIAAWILVACATPAPTPTPTRAPTATPTDTPVPTVTPTPTATPIPTATAIVAPTETPTPEPTKAPEKSVLQLEGFKTVWNSREGRWDYIDVDNQMIAYWDSREERIEITATTLTEKHIGLFTSVSAAEAQKLFDASFVDSTNFKFVFPASLRDLRRGFLLSSFYDGEDQMQLLALVLPRDAVFKVPMGGVANDVSWSSNLIVNVFSSDRKRNFLTFYMADGERLVAGKGSLTNVSSGDGLIRMTKPESRLTLRITGIDTFNALIASAGIGISIDFSNLTRSREGRILCFE